MEASACIKQIDGKLDNLLSIAEANISIVLREVRERNDGNLTAIKAELSRIIHELNVVTDECLAGGVACVKRGRKDVQECLDVNTRKWWTAVRVGLTDLTLYANEIFTFLPLFVQDVSMDFSTGMSY